MTPTPPHSALLEQSPFCQTLGVRAARCFALGELPARRVVQPEPDRTLFLPLGSQGAAALLPGLSLHWGPGRCWGSHSEGTAYASWAGYFSNRSPGRLAQPPTHPQVPIEGKQLGGERGVGPGTDFRGQTHVLSIIIVTGRQEPSLAFLSPGDTENRKHTEALITAAREPATPSPRGQHPARRRAASWA